MKQYFTGLSRNTFLLAAASFFADTSTEMLYPVLPVFLTQTLKASGSIVGPIEGFAQAAQNIVQGFSGALSDRFQRRKGIALAGYLAAAIAKRILEIPFGDRSFRPRQFQQFIFDFADTGYWRPLGDDDLDVCSVQPCRRTHFVSRGLLLRQIGTKKCLARLVYHFCAHLYWLCACTECPNFRCTVYLLRSISGNISGSRKSIRIRFCSRKFTRKRSRMVQQHRRVVGTGGKRRSRTALGPSRPRRRILLWRDVRFRR